MESNLDLKPITPVGFIDNNPIETNVAVHSSFEDTFGKLLETSMPKPISVDYRPDLSFLQSPLQQQLSPSTNIFDKTLADVKKTKQDFNDPMNTVITTPLSQMEPYLKYDSNYDNNITAAFGQGAKGATVGALLAGTTTLGTGTAIGAGVGFGAGFLSGLLAPSGRGSYLPGRDNRALAIAKQEGFFNTLFSTTNNVIDRAFEASIGGTAALLYTPFGAIAGKPFHAMGDNALSKTLYEGKEQSEYKRHVSDAYLAKGPIAKFFTPEGMQNEVADMLGFTLGMVAGVKGQGMLNKTGGSLVSAVAGERIAASITARGGNLVGKFLPTMGKQASSLFMKGAKLEASGIAMTERTFSELSPIGLIKNSYKNGVATTFSDYGTKLFNAIKDPAFTFQALSAFERNALASYGEGRVEAAQSFKDIKETAVKLGYSSAQAEEMASKGANTTLGLNLIILGITNGFGLSMLTKTSSLKNLSKWFTKDWVIDKTTKNTLKNLLIKGAPSVAEGVFKEGFLEELGQFAGSEAAKSQQLKLADPNNPIHTTLLSEFINAYRDGLTSDEGIANWFGGAMFGSAMGMFGSVKEVFDDKKQAQSLNIPESLKTRLTKVTEATEFFAKHSTPFNGQLFTSFSKNDKDEFVEDPSGTFRFLSDPLRPIKLTQTIHVMNSLAVDQANLLLTNVKNNITSTDPKLQKGFAVIKSYLDTFGETGEKTLEEYINKDISKEERNNTLLLLSELSNPSNIGLKEEHVNDLAKNLVMSNYTYDYVTNGMEDKLFDELDLLEKSLSNSETEGSKKDLEFFGTMYKSTEYDQIIKDISKFRQDLIKQVDLFKGLSNRYYSEYTTIRLKGKDGQVIEKPITVDLKHIFRIGIHQEHYKQALEEIEQNIFEKEGKLLSEPGFKEEYLNPNNTSEDVLKEATTFKSNNKLFKELEEFKNLKDAYNSDLEQLKKEFINATDREKLIAQAKKHEAALNKAIEQSKKAKIEEVKPLEPEVVTVDTELDNESPIETKIEETPPVSEKEETLTEVEVPPAPKTKSKKTLAAEAKDEAEAAKQDVVDIENDLAEAEAIAQKTKLEEDIAEAERLAEELEELKTYAEEAEKAAEEARLLAEAEKIEAEKAAKEVDVEQPTSNQSKIEAKKADIERRKQALRDLMKATGDDIFMLGVEDGTFMGEALLNMNENGDVILTRYADSEEGLTKGKGKTKNLKDIAGQFGGEQIATSGIEGGAASFVNGVVGEYHIPLQELIDLIKSEDVVFAGLGNKEFVLSPHIADKYLTKINGKQINAKYDAELKTSEQQLPIQEEVIDTSDIDDTVDSLNEIPEDIQGESLTSDTISIYGEFDAKTPLTSYSIFKTYAADTLKNGTVTISDNLHKAMFYDSEEFDLDTTRYELLPIKLSNNKMAQLLLTDDNIKYYTKNPPAPGEIIYLIIKTQGEIKYAIDKDFNKIPLQQVLEDLKNDKKHNNLLYDKSIAPRKVNGQWVYSTNDTPFLDNKFSLNSVDAENIDKIVDQYLTELLRIEEDAKDLNSENYLEKLLVVDQITPGTNVANATPQKIGEDFDLEIPSISDKKVRAKLLQVIKPGVVYATRGSKYYKVERSKFTPKQIDIIVDLILAKFNNSSLTKSEETYLQNVLNWFDNVDTDKNANKRNSIGIIDGVLEVAPYFLQKDNSLRLEWKPGQDVNVLKKYLSDNFYHYINKQTLDADINNKNLKIIDEPFIDIVTDKEYKNYSSYLKETGVVLLKQPSNKSKLIKTNRQITFIPSGGNIVDYSKDTELVMSFPTFLNAAYYQNKLSNLELPADTSYLEKETIDKKEYFVLPIKVNLAVFVPSTTNVGRARIAFNDEMFFNKNTWLDFPITEVKESSGKALNLSLYISTSNNNDRLLKVQNREDINTESEVENITESEEIQNNPPLENLPKNEQPSAEEIQTEDPNSSSELVPDTHSISRRLITLENSIITEHPAVMQELFSTPSIKLYNETINFLETQLASNLSNEDRLKVESLLRDVRKSFDIIDNDSDYDFDDDTTNRRLTYDEVLEKENIKEFKIWLSSILPQFTVEEIDSLDDKIQGQLYKNLIKIWKNASLGTGYHEAFEAVWKYMLSDSVKKTLINDFKNREGSFEYPFDKRVIKYKDATFLEAKEMLAEGFIYFMKNKSFNGTPASSNNIFVKLWNLLKSFITNLISRFGSLDLAEKTIDDIYSNISKGGYRNFKISEFSAEIANRERFKTPDLKYADIELYESLLHDKFVIDVLNKGYNYNIYALLENAKDDKFSLESFLLNKMKVVSDNFKIEYLENYKKTNIGLLRKDTRFIDSSILKYTFDKDQRCTNVEIKDGFIEEMSTIYVKNFLKKIKLDEYININQIDEIEVNSKEGIVSPNEINPTSNVNKSIRFLLSTLYYMDPNGKKVVNRKVGDNIVEYKKVSFDRAQKTLITLLSNTVAHYKNGEEIEIFEAMINKLNGIDQKYYDQYSWFKDLQKKLKVENGKILTNISENDLKLRIAFVNSFKKAEYDPQILIVDNSNLTFRNGIKYSNSLNVINTWKYNLKKNANIHPNITIRESDQKAILINIPTFKLESEVYAFLKDLGMDLGKPSSAKTALVESIFYDNVEGVANQSIPIDIDHLFNRHFRTKLEELSELVTKDNTTLIKNYKNQDGKTEYAIINPTAISDTFNLLNSVENFEDLKLSLPHIVNSKGEIKAGLKNNIFLNSPNSVIFDRTGKRSFKNSLLLFSGIQDRKTNKGVSFSSLSEEDQLIFKTNALLENKYSLLINGDKNMENGVFLSRRCVSANLSQDENRVGFVINSDLSKSKSINLFVENYLQNQLRDELDLLLSEDVKNIANFSDKKILGYFQDIVNFTKEDYDNLKSGNITVSNYITNKKSELRKYTLNTLLETKSHFEDINLFSHLSIKGLRSFLNGYKDDFFNGVYEFLKTTDYIDPAEYKQLTHKTEIIEKERFVTYFFKNHQVLLASLDQYMADKGSTYSFTREFEEIKNAVVKNTVYNTEVFNRDIQQLMYGNILMYKKNDFAKRGGIMASSKQPVENGKSLNDNLNVYHPRFDGKVRDGNLSWVAYEDVKVVSSRINKMATDFYNILIKQKDITKEQVEEIIGATFDKKGNLISIDESSKDSLLYPYLNMEVSDGQAYIMQDAYFDLMYKSGKLTVSEIVQLDYEKALERNDRNKNYKGTPLYYKYSNKLQQKLDQEIVNKGNPNNILRVLKTQGSGYNSNSNIDAVVPVVLKHSAAPLTWSRVKDNPKLRERYVAWQKAQLDIVTFVSGQKFGSILVDGKEVPYHEGRDTNKNLPAIQKMNFKYFGLQVETSSEAKSKVNRGVQITKIVTGNLSQHMLDPKIKKLVTDYYTNLNEIYERGTEKLYDKLGITYDAKSDTYEVEDLNNLVKSLKEQVVRLDLPINIEDLFVVDEVTGKLPYKFDASAERHRIEYILNSILDSNLIHQKVKGTQAVQISSVFETNKDNITYISDKTGLYTVTNDLSNLSKKELGSLKLTSSDLKILEDGSIEVYLPSYLKGMITFDKKFIDDELLTLIGYRIPTQSLGQVDKIIVKGFLDPAYGDTIMVPSEIVGKAGSDFDIDKLNLYYPHYFKTKDGHYHYIKYTDSPLDLNFRYRTYVRSKESQIFKKEVKRIYEAIDEAYKEIGLGSSSIDIIMSNETFLKLPYDIQVDYKLFNRELNEKYNDEKSKGVAKTMEFKKYTLDLIDDFNELPDGELIDFNGIGYGKEHVRTLKKMVKEYDDLLDQFGVKKASIEEFFIKLTEFQNYKNELLTEDMQILPEQIAYENGLLSLKDFEKLPIPQQNSLEALENRNIELMAQLITLPENRLQLFAPTSAANIKAVDSDINADSEKLPSYAISQFLESTKQRNILVSAKNLIGVGALHVTGHSVCQVGEIEFTSTPDGVNFKACYSKNGKAILYKVYDNSGRLISSNISEFLSSFVDAAKDPFAVRLNINKQTINQLMLLIRLGLSIKEALWFINQPSIKKFVKYFTRYNSIMSKNIEEGISKKQAFAMICFEYLHNIDIFKNINLKLGYGDYQQSFILTPNNIQYVFNDKSVLYNKSNNFGGNQNIVDYIITQTEQHVGLVLNTHKDWQYGNNTDVLLESIKNQKTDKSKYIQLKALLDFVNMNNDSQNLSSLNNVMNIESKYSRSLSENQILLDASDKLMFSDKPVFKNLLETFEKTHLGTVRNSREKFNNYLSPFLLTAKPEFASIITQAATEINRKYISGKDELINNFTNFFITYMIQQNPNFRYNPNLLLQTSMDSLTDRIFDLKSNKSYYKKLNNVFDNLSFESKEINDNFISFVKLFNVMENTSIRNLEIKNYEDVIKLVNKKRKDGPLKTYMEDVKDVLSDLVILSMMQSGVFSGYSSISTSLPSELYSETLDNILKNVTAPNFDTVWKQFIQNFHYDSRLVPVTQYGRNIKKLEGDNINEYIISGKLRSRLRSNFFLNKSEEEYYDADYDEDKTRTISELYEIIDYDKKNDVTILKKITKLGLKGLGIETYNADYEDSFISLYNPEIYGETNASKISVSELTEGEAGYSTVREKELISKQFIPEVSEEATQEYDYDELDFILTYLSNNFAKFDFKSIRDVEILEDDEIMSFKDRVGEEIEKDCKQTK